MCIEEGAALVARNNGVERAAVTAAADHHLHIQSDLATAEMRSMAERLPHLFAAMNPDLLRPRGHEDALAILDEAGIGQGVLLSEAYLFTSPYATPGLEGAADLTRRENMFNVNAALASGGRLAAFVGINPFCDFALDELLFWRGREGVAGVKLHLGNSGFDPRSEDMLATLAHFVGHVADAKLAILVHVRHAGPYEPGDTQRFIARILSRARGVVVQIAHGGGGGGAIEAAEVIGHYADAVERGAPGTEQLFVDLSCVLVHDAAAPDSAAALTRFVDGARRIGVDRLLMGSDWPTLCSPREHDAMLTSQMPFAPAEWTAIAANRAPYLN